MRVRAFAPKTRSGCLTCKGRDESVAHHAVGCLIADVSHIVRRVKCDEAYPACMRCTSTRRKCDGYKRTSRANLEAATEAANRMVDQPSLDINPCARSFFTQHTCHQLAGFFESPFWERFVLQAAHHEPGMRHALVAIGSLHELRTVGSGGCETFALEQYNLSIKRVLTTSSQNTTQATNVCLISSVLFACFEVSSKFANNRFAPHRISRTFVVITAPQVCTFAVDHGFLGRCSTTHRVKHRSFRR
jgi:hypothetical protein